MWNFQRKNIIPKFLYERNKYFLIKVNIYLIIDE